MLFRTRPSELMVALGRAVTSMMHGASKIRRALAAYATVGKFAQHGVYFNFDPDGTYSYATISVGDHVNLGRQPTMLATRSYIRIGSHVMFGPNVTIRGGNHRIDIVGRYLDEIGDAMKRPEDDLGVTIEDDVWIGGNATILHGVTVGRGSVVGADALVTTDVPPYSIMGGVPARVIGNRFTPEQIREHEQELRRRSSENT